MSIKAKLIGLLTACLLVFPTIPAIAKDANADSINNQNVYQKLLNENVTANPVLDLIQDSDKKLSKPLSESPSLLENQANTTPTQDTNLQSSKTLPENPSSLGNQANTSPNQDSNLQISKTLPENTSVYGIDLAPFQPSGWGDMLIASKTPGQHYTDTTFSPNDELYLSYSYINNGTMSTPYTTFYNRFYVDNVLTSTSYFYGVLDPNWYVTGEDLDIGKLSAGTHTIKMVLDTYNAVPEADESNNEYSITVTVTGDKADLVPFKPEGWGDKLIVSKTQGQHYTDTAFSPSDELYLSYACINSGASSTPYTTFYNKFYVDNVLTSSRYFDGVLDPNWYVIGEDIDIGKLNAGTHTIKMVLDTSNAVPETNESNNEYSITVTVTGDKADLVPFKPDGWGDKLIVSKTQGQHYTDTTFSPSDELYLSYACINSGTSSTPYTTFYNKFYVDNVLTSSRYFDGVLDPNWYVIGEDIDIGKLSAGTHTIKMVLDTSNAVPETNESNNEYSITVTVKGDKADLVPFKPDGWGDMLILSKTLGQHYTDTTISPSDELYLSYSCINNGNSSVPDTTVYNKFYVDNVLTSSNYFYGPLDPNWYVTCEDINFGKLSAGTHTIKMVLDASNAVSETNEGNNEYSVTVYVDPGTQIVKSLSADPSSLSLGIGDTEFISLTATYTDGSKDDVTNLATWTSSRPYVATVHSSGFVSALEGGSTTITGSYGGKTATIPVTVNGSPTSELVDVIVQPETVSVAIGKTQAVKIYAVYDDDTREEVTQSVILESDDESIATVSGALIKGVLSGETTVYGTYDGFPIEIPVTVTASVRSLSVDPPTISLAPDETNEEITLTANYTDGTSDDVTAAATWSSNNPDIATVEFDDNWGVVLVTGVANGSTTITGTYGSKTATVKVNVTGEDYILVQPESVCIPYGKTQTVKIYSVSGDTQVDITKSVTLVSDDLEVATVTRGIIKGTGVGDTFVRGTYLDQDIEIPVTVTPPVTKLTADPSKLGLTVDGSEIVTLTATYKDGSEDDVTESALWTSNKPQYATVDEYGMITGVDVGLATITGTYGGKKATIAVNVTPELDRFLVQPSMVGVAKGKKQTVTIYAVYVDGSKEDITKNVRLTSDDTDIATVSGASIKGILPDSETTVWGTYLDQDIEIPVKVTQPLRTLVADTGDEGLNLFVGDSDSVTITATYADGFEEDVNDYVLGISSKPSVATVDIEGGDITITAVSRGSTKITLSYEGKKVTVNVNVSN